MTSKADQVLLAEELAAGGLAHMVWLAMYSRRVLGLKALIEELRAPEPDIRRVSPDLAAPAGEHRRRRTHEL